MARPGCQPQLAARDRRRDPVGLDPPDYEHRRPQHLATSIHNGSTPTGTSRAYIEVADGYVAIGGRGSDGDSERRLVSDNSAPATGAWHHVVGILDYTSSWGTIYVDGRKIDEGALSFDRTSTADTTATCAAIGAQDDGTTY